MNCIIKKTFTLIALFKVNTIYSYNRYDRYNGPLDIITGKNLLIVGCIAWLLGIIILKFSTNTSKDDENNPFTIIAGILFTICGISFLIGLAIIGF